MDKIIYLKHKIEPSDVVYKVWVSYENEKRWVGTCCGNAQPFEKHLYEETNERPAYEHPDFYKQAPAFQFQRETKPEPSVEVDPSDEVLPASGAWF